MTATKLNLITVFILFGAVRKRLSKFSKQFFEDMKCRKFNWTKHVVRYCKSCDEYPLRTNSRKQFAIMLNISVLIPDKQMILLKPALMILKRYFRALFHPLMLLEAFRWLFQGL